MASEETLAYVREEAARFCGQERDALGYTALLLELQKGDKELAHCEVPGQPACAKDVARFLRKQFADNGISQRRCARVAVVVDELFALCCRHIAVDSAILVECGIAPDTQMVNIRVRAMLGGVSPLDDSSERMEEEAAGFIRSQADYAAFQAGEGERDTITVVCFLEP